MKTPLSLPSCLPAGTRVILLQPIMLLLAGLVGLPASAAQNDIPTAQANKAKPVNKIVLDLPPGPGNPRNSEGGFVDLKDGRILFVYSRFEDHTPHAVDAPWSDNAKARLAARYSADNGETWSNDTILATPEEDKAMNVMDVSLLRMQNGDIGMFYNLRRSWLDLRLQLRRSSDEGRTWGEPVQCVPVAGYWVVINDRIIRLASGRLIIPAVLHRQRVDFTAADPNAWRDRKIDNRGLAFFFLSDDDGRTWREANMHCSLPSMHTRTGLHETGLVELPNGVLWAWARTDMSRQYEFFSFDQGENWTQPAPSRFTSPESPMSIERIPGSDDFLSIWNPAPYYETRPLKPIGGDRTPLVAAIGQGPGGKWTPAFVIEGNDEVDAGYHYTAIHFTKDAVLLAYCAGNTQDKHRLNRLRIRKISLDLFRAARAPGS